MRVKMQINAAQGYSADQVETGITLHELLGMVEDAITDWGEDAVVVTEDVGNRYGASFGRLYFYGGSLFVGDTEECTECGAELVAGEECAFKHDPADEMV